MDIRQHHQVDKDLPEKLKFKGQEASHQSLIYNLVMKKNIDNMLLSKFQEHMQKQSILIRYVHTPWVLAYMTGALLFGSLSKKKFTSTFWFFNAVAAYTINMVGKKNRAFELFPEEKQNYMRASENYTLIRQYLSSKYSFLKQNRILNAIKPEHCEKYMDSRLL